MFEGFKSQSHIETPEKWHYFSGTPTSKEFIAAKKFAQKYIDSGLYTAELIDTVEAKKELVEYITTLGNKLMPGISPEEVVAELQKAGAFSKPNEKSKKEKPIERIETQYVTLEGPKQASVDEEQLKIIEANLLWEELEKENVFKNKDELEAVYNKSIELQQSRLESAEYYYAFSDAGLIKGGREEVENDLASLSERKRIFEITENQKPEGKEKLEHVKKIASITERALAFGVTEHKWYGDTVSVEQASEFDDVKRGVDDILEIRKNDDGSTFMALGIDVTFRGLYSEQFKNKFFNLLQSIYDGHKTKVKYFKNHKNELMREFSVPKMVLYFNTHDVKDMVSIIKNSEGSDKEQAQKVNVLSQIILSCRLLSAFAEECRNNIFRTYIAVENSFKELGWENKEIEEIINTEPDLKISQHLKELITEFKLLNAQKAA